ncbi:hypothetical protein NY78_0739 [Desulfovibrio sp. TomC]|nr:hypothetical protein NY78_0739 [Desulfovibrio sp. TomC]
MSLVPAGRPGRDIFSQSPFPVRVINSPIRTGVFLFYPYAKGPAPALITAV